MISGTDPSDAIRVVNALLTQLDSIKNHDNVLILTTSNITGKIDLAFIDRADIKQYIGLPSHAACYQILVSCILELMRAGIILPRQTLLDFKSIQLLQKNEISPASMTLYEISKKCIGLSGRTIRKLPFLSFSYYIFQETVNLEQFLLALQMTMEKEFEGREILQNNTYM
jgi:SpoVK/Ycf46/Vps4 family AAA+-type ATPase